MGIYSSIIMNPANLKVTNRTINNVRKHTISILPWQHKRYYCIDNYTPMFYVAFCVILHIFGSCMSKMAQQKNSFGGHVFVFKFGEKSVMVTDITNLKWYAIAHIYFYTAHDWFWFFLISENLMEDSTVHSF